MAINNSSGKTFLYRVGLDRPSAVLSQQCIDMMHVFLTSNFPLAKGSGHQTDLIGNVIQYENGWSKPLSFETKLHILRVFGGASDMPLFYKGELVGYCLHKPDYSLLQALLFTADPEPSGIGLCEYQAFLGAEKIRLRVPYKSAEITRDRITLTIPDKIHGVQTNDAQSYLEIRHGAALNGLAPVDIFGILMMAQSVKFLGNSLQIVSRPTAMENLTGEDLVLVDNYSQVIELYMDEDPYLSCDSKDHTVEQEIRVNPIFGESRVLLLKEA